MRESRLSENNQEQEKASEKAEDKDESTFSDHKSEEHQKELLN